MSAPVTEAHIAKAQASGYTTEKGVQMAAQFIANNEAAKAERDQLRAEVINLTQSRNNWESACKANDACVVQFKARAERAEAELAAERARLDWLQAQEVKRGLEITEGRDDPLPFLVLGEDGTTHWGKTYRAAIDAAMKEGA